MVLGEDRGAGGAREIEVAALLEIDLRPLAVDGEALADGAQEADPVERDADVHRARELLPDRSRGKRRGGEPVGGVLLDDHDAAAKGGIGEEMGGDGGAHGGASGDDDVGNAVGRFHRSNFVERMIEDCVRSTPSTAPMPSMAASREGTSSASTTARRSKGPETE